MTYIITEPCVGVKDAACVDVCPVDCIYTRDEDDMYYISPDECIDCAACEPVCPVIAIFTEDTVPTQWASYTAMNYDDFKDSDPGAIGWALESQLFQWVVPYHEGAVNYWREIGVWTDAIEEHNQALVRRQAVLASAWGEMTARGIGDRDDFVAAWQILRAQRLDESGFDPVWR